MCLKHSFTMSKKWEATTFEHMLDHLPQIKNAELESELLLQAYFAHEIHNLTPHDLDDARGKRHRREAKKCDCCAASWCQTQKKENKEPKGKKK